MKSRGEFYSEGQEHQQVCKPHHHPAMQRPVLNDKGHYSPRRWWRREESSSTSHKNSPYSWDVCMGLDVSQNKTPPNQLYMYISRCASHNNAYNIMEPHKMPYLPQPKDEINNVLSTKNGTHRYRSMCVTKQS